MTTPVQQSKTKCTPPASLLTPQRGITQIVKKSDENTCQNCVGYPLDLIGNGKQLQITTKLDSNQTQTLKQKAKSNNASPKTTATTITDHNLDGRTTLVLEIRQQVSLQEI